MLSAVEAKSAHISGPFGSEIIGVTTTGAKQQGLPPAAYSRVSPMSDHMQAVLMNPYYLVESADSQEMV